MHDYIIYTDGGYSNSNNVGSGAFVILKPDGETLVCEDSFVVWKETSQRAEFMAILAALKALPDGSSAVVICDNQYATLVLGKIPRRKTKPDVDLLISYRQLVREKHLHVDFKWIRSHIGLVWNEHCDDLCTEALALAEAGLRSEPALRHQATESRMSPDRSAP